LGFFMERCTIPVRVTAAKRGSGMAVAYANLTRVCPCAARSSIYPAVVKAFYFLAPGGTKRHRRSPPDQIGNQPFVLRCPPRALV
jgi:hypothetical protein